MECSQNCSVLFLEKDDSMNKILIHIPIVQSGEYDIFAPTDYTRLNELVHSVYGNCCPNLGNRLWFQGLISEISIPENTIDFWNDDLTADEINERYDMVIAPMANIFAPAFVPLMERAAAHFSGLRIPVYVIACGVQADGTNGLEDLIENIREPAEKLIRAVYETGGEFALRGYVTKEFFDRLGFRSAVVTGCPSLYQMGRNSTLECCNRKVERQDFYPAINGKLDQWKAVLKKYRKSAFFDQEIFFPVLHDPYFFENTTGKKAVRKLVHQYGLEQTELLTGGRVKLIADMGAWYHDLRQNGYTVSVGSRIHGSIMPILAGIPAVLMAQDARTSEIASFMGIPQISDIEMEQDIDLYDIYLNADYSEYNKNFSRHFDEFEAFLKQHGIVSEINTNNRFLGHWKGSTYSPVNAAELSDAAQQLRRHRTYWRIYEWALHRYRALRGV